MNQFFSRLPLLSKLLIIALVPIIFLIYLTFQLFQEKESNLHQIERYLERINESAIISIVIDRLQKERKYSFDYALLRSSGNEMLEQRQVTDSVLSIIDSFKTVSFRGYRSYVFLNDLDSFRLLIDKGIEHDRVLHFYSSAIFRFSTMNTSPSLNNEYLSRMNNNLVSQKILSEMITCMGIINANIYNALYTKKNTGEILSATQPAYELYRSYKREFLVKADPETRNRYIALNETSSLNMTTGYLNNFFATYRLDTTITFQQWNSISENSLQELRGLQHNLLERAEDQIKVFYAQEKDGRSLALVLLAGIIFIIIALTVYIVIIINRSLNKLKIAALKIADGKSDTLIVPGSKDSIGSLTRSILRINEKNKELAIAAQLIGEGNFNIPFKARSSEDLLGNAIISMKQNLQKITGDLNKSREEFMRLADFIPQIVWTALPDGKSDYFNKNWYEFTGINKNNGAESWLPILHPDDVREVIKQWYNSVETGEIFEMEYRFQDAKTRDYRWFLGRALPIKDEAGNIIKWFGTATDINDQKLQHEFLEEQVSRRTMELNRSNEDLQQFAHVASHDLKEPLRKIRLFSERLYVEYGNLIPDKGKIYLGKLQSSSERMSAMIDSVLNYSMIDSTEQHFVRVNLNEIIEEITTDLELLIIKKNAKIIYQHLPIISGVKTLLHQLFYNLIYNSLKFSDDSRDSIITITAQNPDKETHPELFNMPENNKYAEIILQDNGIGFNSDQAENMFKAFIRLNSRDQYEGTGLGLALCKKIVLRHNGKIFARGEPGKGASFHVILPSE